MEGKVSAMGERNPINPLRVAYHEAGHAALAWQSGVKLKSITIIRRGGVLGSVQHGSVFKRSNPEFEITDKAISRALQDARISMAGAEAERIRFGRGALAGTDRTRAIDVLSRIGSEDEFPLYFKLVRVQTRAILKRPATWAGVEALVAALMIRKAIEGPEALSIMCGGVQRLLEERCSARRDGIQVAQASHTVA